jgi:hypothetical protein
MVCLWIPAGLIWCIYCMDPNIPSSGIHIIGNKPSNYRGSIQARNDRRWSCDGWIQCNCCIDPWSMEWMIEHFGLKIRTHNHALHLHWPQKVNDWNPRPRTTPRLTPKCQRLEPTTMHYTTIDPGQKSKIRAHDHALHHHWFPKRQIFEPKTKPNQNSCDK